MSNERKILYTQSLPTRKLHRIISKLCDEKIFHTLKKSYTIIHLPLSEEEMVCVIAT